MTDVCPTCFGTSLLSPPEPLFESAEFWYVGPGLLIEVTFDVDMRTGTTPANGVWEAKVDGVQRNVESQAWQSARVLRLTLVAGGDAAVGVTIELLTASAALASTYRKQAQPFGPEAVPRQ